MKVAIVHYWLLNMRGGERLLEALCRLFPQADLFTLFYDPARVSPLIRSRRVTASFLNPFRRYYRSLLPLMPWALEDLDLRGYDLVLSSESGPAKGVILPASATHVCYCHTPPRYLWHLYHEYLHEWTRPRWKQLATGAVANYLRLWDFASAARVDRFIANSENVRRRILKAYRRDATVIHPPVPVETFRWEPPAGYYLIVSELVAYKRIDLAVTACSRSGRKLRIVGDGPEYRNLRKLAGPSVEFCGRVSDSDLRTLYAQSRAFLQPGEEDFGMTTVESIASGKPVIALARGGVLEIARDRHSGFFFPEPTVDSLLAALAEFERHEDRLDPAACIAAAAPFSEANFARKFTEFLALSPRQMLTSHA